ncbi:MAG: amidinotransferase, partial [Proteobacteria bacterium]|nr:amidinotransferase [Pseudomonadota bacterium]
MHFTRAITRAPGDTFASGLTTVDQGQPDLVQAHKQHRAYCEGLKALGLSVTVLPPEPDFPDAVFVEDTAVMLPDAAVITRPGAPTRQGEEDSIETALMALPTQAGLSAIHRIQAPGTVDGGDVMEVDGHYFIGISKRTNEEGARQLGNFIEASGVSWSPVPVVEQLHLKTSVNFLGKHTLAVTQAFADRPEFKDFKKIVLAPDQEAAANCILVGSTLIMARGFPETRTLYERLGWDIMEMDMSEFQKM